MRVVIIEDEKPAARRLSRQVEELLPAVRILQVLDSVSSAVDWFESHSAPELIFMDIQLADGLSFDIFNQVSIEAPIIFTTAYDQYVLKAFKVNSIDYLLKPIDPEELKAALDKYEQLKRPSLQPELMQQLMESLTQKNYKERFLIKKGQQLAYIPVGEIAYFFSSDGLVQARDQKGKNHLLDYPLDQIERLVDPDLFFRINRKLIVELSAIQRIHTYFNSRLILDLSPPTDLEAIVSRDRVSDFKKWLDR
jgi:DNA-binding LytR/AlgR family response regulator